MLSVQGLVYRYAGDHLPLLSSVSLTVQRGEFVSLIGASGCGKSTLFRIIAGLLEADEGEVRLQGGPPLPAAQRLGMTAYMPQQDLLLPWRTVLENSLLPWELKPAGSKAEAVASIRSLLSPFGLEGRGNAFPQELSGGMRQRAALLRTVAAGGGLMLLDEPFGALDAITKRGLQRWLLELWGSLRRAVLFITHDLEEALLLSDRIYLLQGGEAVPFSISLPRPRHEGMRFEPEFLSLRQELEQRLQAAHAGQACSRILYEPTAVSGTAETTVERSPQDDLPYIPSSHTEGADG